MSGDAVSCEVDPAGVATLTWDMSGRSVNLLNPDTIESFARAVERAVEAPGVKGVVLASGKDGFIAGGDLEAFMEVHDPRPVHRVFERLHGAGLTLERGGKPVVAAINGSALGGGLELCLACHRRIAARRDDLGVGLPEVPLGLFPAGGGTQRLPRLLGIRPALDLILSGRTLGVDAALNAGLVDEVVEPSALLTRARQWVAEAGPTAQPWDRRGYRVPGGAVQSASGVRTFTGATAALRARTWGQEPAALDALACVYEGLQVSLETGLLIERRRIARRLTDPATRARIRTLFFGARRPGTEPDGGPFAERLRAVYWLEGMCMLDEGVGVPLLENAARLAGMREGPLQVLKAEGARAVARARSAGLGAHPGLGVAQALAGRLPAPPPRPPAEGRVDPEAIGRRLLLAQAAGAARDLEAGLIGTPLDGDACSVLHAGFPPTTGGVFSYVDLRGASSVVAECGALAVRHGDRFEPGPGLRALAREGGSFHTPLTPAD